MNQNFREWKRLKDDYTKFYLENIHPELVESFEEVMRVLKPGGKFTMSPLPMVFATTIVEEYKAKGYQFEMQEIPPVRPPALPEMAELDYEYQHRLVITKPE